MNTVTAKTPRKQKEKRQLPAGWRWVRLGEVCEFIRGVAFDKTDVSAFPADDRVPILRAGNIGLYLDTSNDLIWVPNGYVRPEQFLRVGDAAICMSSGSADVVGKTAIVEEEWKGSVGAFCGIVRAKNQSTADFVNLWFRSRLFLDWRDDQARGANIQNLRFSQFAKLETPLPPLEKQQQIAGALKEQLAQLEKARAAAQARLEAVQALPAAYLRQVFPKPGQSLPAGWRVLQLGDAGEVVSGVTIGRTINGRDVREVPYLRVANVKDGYLDLSEMTTTPATPGEIEALKLRKGDLLLTEGGDPDKLERGTLWEKQIPECIHQNHIFRVRLNRALVEPTYASALIGSSYGKGYFLKHAKQTTGIATINQRVLKAFPIIFPPLPDQMRIAEMIKEQMASAEKARVAAESELAAIEALPTALLRRAFNGES